MSATPLRFGIPLIGSPAWTGGVVYTANMAEALRSLGSDRPRIHAVVSPATAERIPHNRSFMELCDGIVLYGAFHPSSAGFFENLPAGIEIHQHADLASCRQSIDFLFPVQADVVSDLPSASWIPDFQHHHLPEFFSKEELDERTRCFDRIARQAKCVVFSSRDAEMDFHRFHPGGRASARVLHFRSSLRLPVADPTIRCSEMGIPEDFVLCSNQFWAHKDHATLFRAVSKLRERGRIVQLVCTGAPSDYRNNAHYRGLLGMLAELGIEDQVRLLGLVPREDQLALMRCARFLVQPSLFEGWSTVLEDIRCVGTPVIASDLPVHEEQDLENAVYFRRRDPDSLAAAMEHALERSFAGPDPAREARSQERMAENLRAYGQDLVRLANSVLGVGMAADGTASGGSRSVREMAERAKRLRSRGDGGNVRLSAIVSVYKAERFLRGCLDDLLDQTLWTKGALEIIVVDTGSPESESDIVREYQSRHGSDRIRLIRTEDRRGIYSAWNLGIAEARGAYLTNANADDRHHPEGLERLVDALEADRGADLAYADSLCTKFENETWATTRAHARFWWPEFELASLFRGNYVGPHPVWRKSLHDRYGLFREDLRIAGDYEYWLRVASSGCRFLHVPRALGLYLEGGAEASNLELSKQETENVKSAHWRLGGAPPPELPRGYQAERDPVAAIWSNLCFGMPERARRIAKDASPENPAVANVASKFDRLEALFAEGRREEALGLVGTALAEAGKSASPTEGNSPLGDALQEADRLFSSGDVSGAVAVLEPHAAGGDLRLLTALGWLESNRGDSAASLRWYTAAAEQHPGEISAWSNLAGIQIGSGDRSAAESSLRRILSISPNDPDALVALVRLLGTTGRGREAGAYARRFVAAHHGRPEREEFLGAFAADPRDPRGVPFPKDHGKGRIVALVSSFNEGDVIRPVLEGLIAEGVDVYLIDNCSTDDTVEQASALLGRGVIHIERFPQDAGYPVRSEKEYVWADILRRKEEISLHLGADWYLHADADEFRESPWNGLSLAEAIRRAEAEGWNAINYELFNFRPVDDGFPRGGDPRKFLTGYEPGDWFDSVQIKTWRNPGTRVDLVSTGGHSVSFPGRKVCPVPFILRHYPIRSETHGRRKVMTERLGRFSAEEKARGWHVQYDDFRDGTKRFLFSPDRLRSWGDGAEARRAILERHRTDMASVEECKGVPGTMELAWDALARRIDVRVGTNLVRNPQVLQEADGVLRGFAENPDAYHARIEPIAASPLGAIWREISSVRASQARLAGEIHLARGYRTIHAWLASASGSGADAESPSTRQDAILARLEAVRDEQSRWVTARRAGMPESASATIVIPVHNGTELTRNCLDSLFATPSRCRSEVVVVDDASTDGTIGYLRSLRDAGRIKLVEHASNQGFAASCNDGAKSAAGDVLVFLNNDTIVQPGWLDALVDELVRDDSVGIAGSRLLYPDGRIQHAGIVWEWKGDHPHPEHVFRRAPGDSVEVGIRLDYPAVTGACLAIPAPLFRELDGFSREFGMYCEDVDLCLRVWDKGLRVRYVPDSRLFHLESATPIDIHARAEKSRAAADMLRDSWKGRWPAAYFRMPSWMWPEQVGRGGVAKPVAREAQDGVPPRYRVGFDARTLSVADSVVRGIGNYAWHHLVALLEARPGCDLTVLRDDEVEPPVELVDKVKALGGRWAAWSERSAQDFDVFHTPDPMHVYPGYASPFQRFGSTRASATFHDIIPIRVYEGRVANWPGYLARLDELADHRVTLLCNSEFTRKDLLDFAKLDGARVVSVGAGFNAADAEKPLGRSEGDALLRRLGIGKPFFLHVGAADPHKNFESALAACQTLSRTRPVQFVVVGKVANSLKAMRDRIAEMGLKDVVFTDYLSREELEVLYARAVATLFLSRYEGFGFPALEAMACGCPVVASNAASIPEVVGDAAVIHAPDDLSAIVESMRTLLDDPEARNRLSRKGRERAGQFRWSDVAARTWRIWDDLVASSPVHPVPAPAPARCQWISPVWDPSGYADESRAFIRHLSTTDLAPGLLAFGRHSETFRQAAEPSERKLFDSLMGRELAPDRVVVIDLPGSGLGRVAGAGYHVGRTTFETDSLPADWVPRCNSMDEIWVPCRFNRETFAKAGVQRPVLVVPQGVDTARFRPGLVPLSLPGPMRGTTFLAVFEWTRRKGADVLLAAWAKAFSASDDVRLVLRTYPPNAIEGDPVAWVDSRIEQELARVGRRRGECAPIVVLASQVPDADMPRLYAASDVYLAPSRGEGWGRPHMEAMSCGVPVVATRWSGNLEFQDDDNSWLIALDGMETIDDREEFPGYKGHRWASPSVDDLSRLMSLSASDVESRRRKGAKARADMVARWDWRKIAPLAEIRLREILDGVPAERSVLAAGYESLVASATASCEAAIPAVRWVGPVFNFSGYARFAREALEALDGAGVVCSVDPSSNDPEWFRGLVGDQGAIASWKKMLSTPADAADVLVVCDIPRTADGTGDLLEQVRSAYPEKRVKVAWCMFESDSLPRGWVGTLNRMDQVWVPSRHNLSTFAAAGVDASRLRLVPCGIDARPFDAVRGRPLEIPGPKPSTTFLSVFQWSLRKGWDVLLEAWAEAFGPADDVRLVLRCHGMGDGPSIDERLDSWCAERGRDRGSLAPIVIADEFIPEPDMPRLYEAADVFVLPSRGEGWGIPYLEAMAAGKPVIGVAWGGAADFLHEGVGWMLPPGGAVPVPRDASMENPFLDPFHRWADPKVSDLVAALREAASSPEERCRRGSVGAEELRRIWNPENTAKAVRAALSQGASPVAAPAVLRLQPALRGRIPIAMPAYNRDQYLVQTLSALRECRDRERFYIVTGEEPGCPATRALFDSVDWMPIVRYIGSERMGCNANVLGVADRACSMAGRFVLLEDDLVPGRDYLSYVLWGLRRFEGDASVFGLTGYRRALETPEERSKALAEYSNWFSCWGWATWGDRWERFRREVEVPSDASDSWDVFVCNWVVKAAKLREVRPVVGRIQNIGEVGTWVLSPEWQRENQRTPFWVGNLGWDPVSASGFRMVGEEEQLITRLGGTERISGVLASIVAGFSNRRAPEPHSPMEGRGGDDERVPPTPASEAEVAASSLSIRWEGSQLVHHSLAHVNRELCVGLARRGHDLSIIPYEPDQFAAGDDPELRIIEQLTNAPLEAACQVHVRHQWPPNLVAPAEGRWVVIQPWEFGSPPKEWVDAFSGRLDDLWVPSNYCRDLYIAGGVDPERVHVVPNGVDCDRFRPGLAPLASLPPKKGVRFLYVGGSIARKGFDVLLNAWQKAFGPDDPVELLIKDMGGKTTYAGQTGERFVRQIQESGRFATIHYVCDDLPPSDLPALYASGDVLVHPYRGEGFGLPIAEAMACGLPVVITAGGAADDFCGPDEGWMIPSSRVPLPGGKVDRMETVEPPWWLEPSEEVLVAALREAAQDAEARRRKGAAARERIARNFTWQQAVDAVEARLRLVVERPVRRTLSPTLGASIPLVNGRGLDAVADDVFLIESCVARGDMQEADRLADAAVEMHPRDPSAWLARAMVYRGLKKPGRALEALDRALEVGGGPEVRYEMLALHLQSGKEGPARTQWNILRDKHPDWVERQKRIHREQDLPWLPDRLPSPGKGKGKAKSRR